jgi:hypothetical protein
VGGVGVAPQAVTRMLASIKTTNILNDIFLMTSPQCYGVG